MRYTEYHAGKAVIKDKNKLAEAMEKLAEFEEKEKCGEWLDAIELAKIAIALQSQKWIPCSERQPEDEGYILVSFELEEVKPERTVREIREIRTPDPESEEEEGQLPGQMSDEDLSEVAEHMKAMMKILEKYRKE